MSESARAVDESSALQLLQELASIPTASFHEAGVATYVKRFLRELGLPYLVDPFGDIIATYRNGASPNPVALVAHMDHPAIEVTEVASTTSAYAALLGGVASACFRQPVPVRLFSGDRELAGTIVGQETNPETNAVSRLELRYTGELAPGAFGVFDLPSLARDGDVLSLRAADDLAGLAAALLTLREIVNLRLAGIIYVVITRAEEVGLVGASLVAEQGLLPANTIVVSLECSRSLPGAEPGEGPVIRVGDRARAFHPEGEALLIAARAALPGVKVQRQLMSGGTCEATAFGARGYRSTGVALPLVNYHNVGPNDVISPEQIRVSDFLGEVALLTAACRLAIDPPLDQTAQRLSRAADQFRDRLRGNAAEFGDSAEV